MSNDSIRERLIGTWKLVSAMREDIPSGAKSDFLGADPVGFINYGARRPHDRDQCRQRPREARRRAADAAEAETLFRSMTSYAGSYTIDGNVVTHHVDMSWNEAWTGTEQKRIARFDGDRAYLSTPPSTDPVTGTMSVRTMTWEKVK